MSWQRKNVVVTGGAGFIGSNLVGALLERGAEVTVVDKLLIPTQQEIWSRKVGRLLGIFSAHGAPPRIHIIDLELDKERFQLALEGVDTVFHLSAVFGGREFVDKRQTDCAAMLAIDRNVIDASHKAGVKHVHYASSACVYPPSLQRSRGHLLYENDVCYDPEMDPTGRWWELSDNLYGWAKLCGELECRVYHEEKGLSTSTCRYLTVYGPGEFDESHAISALINKALRKEDPFEVWGSGDQERGFTYVDDIVEGSIRAAERVTDGMPINLGTDKRYRIRDVVCEILREVGHNPRGTVFNLDKPEGPFSRALDVSRAKEMLGWEPKVDIHEGIQRTVEWHKSTKV